MSKCPRSIAISLVLSSLLIGSSSVGAQTTDEMLTNFIDSLNAAMPPSTNGEAVADLFSIDGVQAHAMGAPPGVEDPQDTREEIAAFFNGFELRWSSWTHTERTRTIAGRRAVWEGTASGVFKETGKEAGGPMVLSLEFDDEGKVKSNYVYFNGQMLAAQLQ